MISGSAYRTLHLGSFNQTTNFKQGRNAIARDPRASRVRAAAPPDEMGVSARSDETMAPRKNRGKNSGRDVRDHLIFFAQANGAFAQGLGATDKAIKM
jgi:hypothetical protein